MNGLAAPVEQPFVDLARKIAGSRTRPSRLRRFRIPCNQTVSTSSSKFLTTSSGLGPRGSRGTPGLLIQQTLKPKFLDPITSKEFDETKSISFFCSRIYLGASR